jgi:hypothetical protein
VNSFVFNGIHEIMCHAVKASIRSGAYGESPRTAAEARAQLASHVPQHKQEGRETAEREESRGNSESAGEAYPAEFLGQLRDKVVVQAASECVCASVRR